MVGSRAGIQIHVYQVLPLKHSLLTQYCLAVKWQNRKLNIRYKTAKPEDYRLKGLKGRRKGTQDNE